MKLTKYEYHSQPTAIPHNTYLLFVFADISIDLEFSSSSDIPTTEDGSNDDNGPNKDEL